MLQIHEILDRYEILYPANPQIADLRRAYVDKDLASIFRILPPNIKSFEIEDLRSLTLTQNIHALFKIVDADDLRKLIINDNIWSLWRELNAVQPSAFTHPLKTLICLEGIEFNRDCFARNQLLSKKWVVDTLQALDLDLGIVFLCAGWYGTLATMLFENNISIEKLYSIDLDPSTVKIARIFNQEQVENSWRFQAVVENIMSIDYVKNKFHITKEDDGIAKITASPDTIINTSCEHIENFGDWWNLIPNGKLVILQSNDFFGIEDHVNCSESLEAFSAQTPMTNCLYSGQMNFEHYNRFMRIGIK